MAVISIAGWEEKILGRLLTADFTAPDTCHAPLP